LFRVEVNAKLMIETLESYRVQGRFALHAFVVMPDHVHALITPAPDVSLEKAIQLMKGGFSYRVKSRLDVWERGHFDKRVPDRLAYVACVNYIRRNPVEAGLVEREEEYEFSSVRGEVDPMPDWFR
jgi:putative transposase